MASKMFGKMIWFPYTTLEVAPRGIGPPKSVYCLLVKKHVYWLIGICILVYGILLIEISILELQPSHQRCFCVISILASCPSGPVTANGVDLLIKIYVIYMEAHTYNHATDHVRRSNSCGRIGCDGRPEGKLGNI